MKNFLFFLILIPLFVQSQSNFYIGAGSISTIAKIKNQNSNYEKENLDFGLYYGNNILISDKLITTIEVFYLNQEVILNRSRSSKFELHQNIGFGLKPGFFYGKHSWHFSGGILGVYVYDKNNQGNQFDHFDESFYYGLDYNYDLSNKLSLNLGMIISNFQSISIFSERELEEFTVFQMAMHYKIF